MGISDFFVMTVTAFCFCQFMWQLVTLYHPPTNSINVAMPLTFITTCFKSSLYVLPLYCCLTTHFCICFNSKNNMKIIL